MNNAKQAKTQEQLACRQKLTELETLPHNVICWYDERLFLRKHPLVPVLESEQSVSKPEYEFHTPTGEWCAASGKVTGIWQQVLSADPQTGAYTGLTRYEPGTDTSPNGPARHDYWEEIFILEGDLTDLRLGQTFQQGMYACRPPGMVHGPWRSESGALMLEIRYPALAPS